MKGLNGCQETTLARPSCLFRIVFGKTTKVTINNHVHKFAPILTSVKMFYIVMCF